MATRAAPAGVDLAEVQGIVVRGYGRLRAARYVLGRIVHADRASAWLGALVDELDDGRGRPAPSALNVALTPSGLVKLGLPSEALGQFSREFLGGMTAQHRSRLLGDVEESAPSRWDWGGPGGETIDLALLLYAADEVEMRTMLDAQVAAMAGGGVRVVRTLDTAPLEDREHFGFRDGVSQPRIEELGEAPYAHSVKAGEFILGYRNGYGLFTPRPLVDAGDDPDGLLAQDAEGSGKRDLGRGGTYLVLRQLGQDVRAFWEFCDRATRRPDGSSDADARVWLATKMVGRWPSGAPLALAPEGDRPELADANDFGYHADDRHGLRCPVGAHVRRANPRDSLDPQPGSRASIEAGNHHRLLRRGRQYGRFLPREELLSARARETWGDEQRGLRFVCLCGNLSRQFEFVQHTWLNSPRFAGLYDEPDPLLGRASRRGRRLTVPADPVRLRYSGLPRFVSVRGGAYFFLPGIRALRFLAAVADQRNLTNSAHLTTQSHS